MLRLALAMTVLFWAGVRIDQARPQDTAKISTGTEKYSSGVLQMSIIKADSKDPRVANLRPGAIWHKWEFIVLLKTVSSRPVTFIETAPECDYAIEVLDSSGKPAALTLAGERLPRTDEERVQCLTVSIHRETLQPGQEYTEDIDLGRLFRLDPGQTYTVRLRRSRGFPAKGPDGRPVDPELIRSLKVAPSSDDR